MNRLIIWTIYKHPKDYPDHYVARKFLNDQPTNSYLLAESLKALRNKMPVGLCRIPRDVNDEPHIVEVWI